MRKSAVTIAGYDETSPEVIAAAADTRVFARLMDSLVANRRAAGLSQADVATRMGTKQSAISDLERTSSNPRIRTLFRYARALGLELRFRPLATAAAFAAVGASETVEGEQLVAPVGKVVVTLAA